jgi:hypothetical protein
MIDLVTDSEDEVALPLTPHLGEVVPMDTSEDTESKIELLREMESITLSWEESRESTRVRGKRVIAWGRRTAKRTRVEMRGEPQETQ